jgi:glycosyltransferase involved in cell wall biosynthesis
MRIGVNCCNVSPDYVGGVNTYVFGLLDAFAGNQKYGVTFVVFCFQSNEHLFEKYKTVSCFQVVILRNIHRFYLRIIWQFVKLKQKNLYHQFSNYYYRRHTKIINAACDVLYFPNTVMNPYNYTVPTVLSMHDIQQVHFPQFFTSIERKSRKIMYELSAEHATYMQASSRQMKGDFCSHFKLKDKKVFIIHEGVSVKEFKQSAYNKQLFAKYSIPEKFLFYPAQLWPHKNHITVLKALHELKSTKGITIPLVLTGAKFSAYDEMMSFIQQHNLSNVYYLGKVPFADLLAIYRASYYLITAVLYESSSLPILEAAASGTAILASDTDANRELGETLYIQFFPTTDVQCLATKLQEIWNDEEGRNKAIEHNRSAIHHFNWERVAEKYIEQFSRIKNEFNRT